ncbi:MAG: dihydrofolate reductase family protein [Acidimicrobiales bacterium]
MRRLLPSPADDVDPAAAYRTGDRVPPPGRPWVLIDMVASADGATHAGGVSGALSAPADKAVFAAVRGVADVILVGASTVRAEGYGPARPSAAVRAARVANGQDAVPTIAVVSGRLELDWSTPLFTESPARPIVVTGEGADPARMAAAGAVADLVVTEGGGAGRADLEQALGLLRDRGASVVVCEGGPSLNGLLVDLGLVDEVCLTWSPTLVGGDSPRVAVGRGPGEVRSLGLAHLLEADGLLFARYLRA